MRLNELTTPFETKQVITYAPNGNTVMNRNRSLRHISYNIYLDKDYKIYVCYQIVLWVYILHKQLKTLLLRQ